MLPLGTRVVFTKCASSRRADYLRDMPKGMDHRWMPELQPDEQRDGDRRAHNNDYERFVDIWDEEGEGIIVGLTTRLEGKIHPGYGPSSQIWGYDEGEPTEFEQTGRHELYEVRCSTTDRRTYLVPVDAILPTD
jgi:hypothetical protein